MARRKAQASDVSQVQRQSTPDNSTDDIEESLVPPFFNTTFSTHRISPLYIGTQKLNQTRLDLLAHRLRDTLVGDVVRGIQVGLEATDTPIGQVGPLRAVKFRWFHASAVLSDGELVGGNESLLDDQKQGLWIEIRHENASYVALLLPGYSNSPTGTNNSAAPLWSMQPENPQGAEADQSHFIHLPLLLLRMPQALKSVIGDWLSTTFDCRVSKLNLGTKTLVSVWEGWIQAAGLPSNSADLVLTLAFNAPLAQKDGNNSIDSDDNWTEAGLRSMDVSISSSDLRRFLRAGKALQKETRNISSGPWENDNRERRRLAGPNVDDGWAWRKNKDGTEHPFTEALAQYLNHYLALNLFHPSVRVVQVSCGGFVLAQSRVKIIRPGGATDDLSRAAWMFVMQLGERIRGGDMPSIT
ncbi:hypothetical protein PT974_02169 [Cladobotryum mycophilum]|uniref:Siroheme synthase n=1 Tax=Cladobotryum mycophilum TaxID=491253 RepID=A0ABR0SXG4_9HYPO